MKTRPILSIFLLSLTASFMFFIFEPISLFANNPDDFWFSVPNVLPILLAVFVGCTVATFLVLLVFDLFCKKVIKKPKIFDYTLAILTAIFIITYVQGNFLSASLPGLTGQTFIWQDYPVESVLSIALWAIVFALLFVVIKKFSIQKVVSSVPIAIGIILIMLSVGLISTVVSRPDALAMKDEEPRNATLKNYNSASNQQNFYILLVDMVDSQSFDNALKDNPNYQTAFQDFTYYPDTTSYYAFTKNSVPQILTGVLNYNEKPYDEYLSEAYGGGSTLFSNAAENGYKLNLYDSNIHLPSEVTEQFDNYVATSRINPIKLIKRIIRFDLFKYLPYPLKSLTKIELCRFDAYLIADSEDGSELFDWDDLKNYNLYKNQDIEISDDKMFSFIHLEGSHEPFNYDENVQKIESNNGTYTQKNGAVFTIIEAFLNRLKQNGVYNNSVIMVMSDHGYGSDEEYMTYDVDVRKRVNPILCIKGIQETHPEMIRSDKPVSFSDLDAAYGQLLQGQPSTELFADVNYPRTRKFILYDNWLASDMMEEYETDGTAWDIMKMRPTGAVYKLDE